MLGWRDSRLLGDVLPAEAAALLAKEFGFETCGDLLNHYPRDYVRHGTDVGLGNALEGDFVTVTGQVVHVGSRYGNNGKSIVTIRLDKGVEATFFSQPWIAKNIVKGHRIMLSGKLKFFRNQPQLQSPSYALLGQKKQASSTMKELAYFGSLEELLGNRPWIPVYPATAKVTSWFLMGAIHQVLESLDFIEEPLDFPQPISYDQALRQVHEPGPEGPYKAIERLKYNEALTVGLVMALRRRDSQLHAAAPLALRNDGSRRAMVDSLPYSLTQGQQDVVAEISADLGQTFPMQRLLQGEVGSGKTVVAVLSMLQAVDAGKQAALLAPTEVLASQHSQSIAGLVPSNVNVVLLTGAMKTAEKRQALLDIVSGDADIVIGTHAIIQDTVEFFDLGLVIIDEQHRFGVEQRDSLRTKTRDGLYPHTLVMTATPIPRTVAMTVFGDLTTSTLSELPGGRKPISSFVIPQSNEQWVERGWARIREEVAQGHQAYIVCPRIEGPGGALELAQALTDHPHAPLAGVRVAILHGRMPDKDEVMKSFSAGEFDVLISTTVIEVGVDVPNATVMLIRESENFGVSQLHQLRGRVGRGGNASLCLFHTMAGEGSPSYSRISAIAATNSGFELAEIDLANRQEGDVLGTTQSGARKTLRLLNLLRDQETIERAAYDADGLVARNPDLAAELVKELTETEQEYLDKN